MISEVRMSRVLLRCAYFWTLSSHQQPAADQLHISKSLLFGITLPSQNESLSHTSSSSHTAVDHRSSNEHTSRHRCNTSAAVSPPHRPAIPLTRARGRPIPPPPLLPLLALLSVSSVHISPRLPLSPSPIHVVPSVRHRSRPSREGSVPSAAVPVHGRWRCSDEP